MDINEKDNILESDVAEATAEPETDTASEETVSEDTVAEENTTEENTSEDGISEEDSFSTLGVDQDDIDEEMSRYGALSENAEDSEEDEEQETDTKKKRKHRPLIIAAVAFLLTAAAVLGTLFVYNQFLRPGINGVWMPQGGEDAGTYLVFDREGNITIDSGGIKQYGTYTMDTMEGMDVLTSEFGFIANNGGMAIVEQSTDKKTLTLTFMYGSMQFNKAKLPDLKTDPTVITHASADELGIDKLNVDKNLVGEWRLGIMGLENVYETYIFNENGTGTYTIDYAPEIGYGLDAQFKYTVCDDQILLTYDSYSGAPVDMTLVYLMDKGNLVLNGVGFEAVK